MTKSDQEDAEAQFPVVDPALIHEALRVLKLPRGHRPGSTAVSVTVELTALQVNYLLMRSRERRHKLDRDAALKREIETLISLDMTDGLRSMYKRVNPWLGLIQRAKLGPQLQRLRKAVRRE